MTLQVILILIIFVLITIIFILFTKKQNKQDNGSMQMLQNQMLHLTKTLDMKLSESSKLMSDNINKTFETSTKINLDATKKIEEITAKLTSLEETNKQIKDIGGQLEGLEKILVNTNQRGILGQYLLENVLKNILPPTSYQLQYQFKNGDKVDAVIFIKDKIIPIDSKFSRENYNKILLATTKHEKEMHEKELKNDLKKRIDETSKYIRINEKTMDFSFMFIPSESLYYDLLVNKIGSINSVDLIEYAYSKKVTIVSPTSFCAYLQTVLQGLRAMHIEESVKDIQYQVVLLGKHLHVYEEYMKKLGNSLNTTLNHYEHAYKEFGKIDKDVEKITAGIGGGEVEVLLIEKPQE